VENLNINIEKDVKIAFERFCDEIGVNISVVFNMFAKSVVRQQSLPLELVSLNVPNAETLEALEEVRQMKNDPSFGKSYTDIDVMMRELLA
jgi:DNA-damage-inducible protein J